MKPVIVRTMNDMTCSVLKNYRDPLVKEGNMMRKQVACAISIIKMNMRISRGDFF